jgi:hypothetical protein
VPAGTPLGVGGIPFETSHFELPDGGIPVLYTDGPIETSTPDINHGIVLLCDILTAPAAIWMRQWRCPSAPVDATGVSAR